MKSDLTKIPTSPPESAEKSRAKKQAKAYGNVIADLVEQFAAVKTHALLIIFQGMDASGKDGAVKAAFERSTPANISVHGWGKPTELEMRHDFLWRLHQKTPAKGEIAVWNRSHYEDVLIQRVHGWVDKKTIDNRFDAINAFERNLMEDNNTIILKFLLHTSYDEQKEQLQERIDDPTKHYKHNPNDWKEREHWDEYMKAYNDVLQRSKHDWIIIPTDKRWYRDFLISKTIMDALEGLNMEWPALEKE